MNKKELIDAVAEHVELPKATVAKVLSGLLDVIPMAVAAGEPVAIVGFGTFEAAYRQARAGRNPHTGEPLKIAETWAPKFSPGSVFKETVRTSNVLTSA
ncbi:HU family DNA-binding protein [Streptosporangium longisporum]|uniref:DNA-binding protein HU-beta n=1 Tax=Streptosporangium longisporum TaxID=46187 RepID=A0ABP6LFB1_9ACTN